MPCILHIYGSSAMCDVYSCVFVDCMHAKCMCVLLLLIQCKYLVCDIFRVKIKIRVSFMLTLRLVVEEGWAEELGSHFSRVRYIEIADLILALTISQ